jgi:hypothetical protein
MGAEEANPLGAAKCEARRRHGEDCRGVICEADEAGQHGTALPQTSF